MKAIATDRLGGTERLRLIDIPRPEPQSGQVRIQIKAAGVGIWDETFIHGEIPQLSPRKFPAIPGWEGAGVISAVGPGVTRFKPGDEVFFLSYPGDDFDGAWAEETLVAERCVGHKPASLSMVEAGGFPIIALTAYQALKRGLSLKSGQSLLICSGAGGVGTCAIQLAKIMEVRVLALAGSANHPLLRELGAEGAFDYHGNFVSEIQKLFPNGVDCVFDDVGEGFPERHGTIAKAMACLKTGGVFVTIVEEFEDLKRPDVRGGFLAVEADGKELEEIARFVDEGKLRVVIDQVYSLTDFRQAMEKVKGGHVHGKVVLKVA